MELYILGQNIFIELLKLPLFFSGLIIIAVIFWFTGCYVLGFFIGLFLD